MYQVQKKDGRQEPFDRNKIINGILNSGASNEEAEKVATAIENWLPTVAKGQVVKAMDIRSEVLRVLKTVNAAAAASFGTYQKPVQG